MRIEIGDTKIIWKLTNAHSCLNLPLMMISAEVIETSVAFTDNLLSQLLGSTLTWKIKLRRPKVVLCSNYSLFNTNHKKWIMWNSLIKVPVIH